MDPYLDFPAPASSTAVARFPVRFARFERSEGLHSLGMLAQVKTRGICDKIAQKMLRSFRCNLGVMADRLRREPYNAASI
jgi:hypothetical protein